MPPLKWTFQSSVFSLNKVLNLVRNSEGEKVASSNEAEHTPGKKNVEGNTRKVLPSCSNNDSGHHDVHASSAIASPPINVIVFGESGVGKSSVINMLMEKPVAAVSNKSVGRTYESNRFQATIAGREVMLYDTAGLNEAEAGTVSPDHAVHKLYSLVRELKTVSLLVYCIRGIRFREIVADNYNIVCNVICGGDRKVPVALVITGLENEEDMDDWWEDNEADFDGMGFCGHACITATRGRASKDGSGYVFQDLYDASTKKVQRLLADNAFGSSITIIPPRDAPSSMHAGSNMPNVSNSDSSSDPWFNRFTMSRMNLKHTARDGDDRGWIVIDSLS